MTPNTPALPAASTLEVVEWTEKQTMAAIRDTASFGTVKLTSEYGPYDIDRPTFHCDRLVEAIVAARDAQWQAEIQALRADARRWDFVRHHWSNMQMHWNKDATNSLKSITLTIKTAHWTSGADDIEKQIDAALSASGEGGQ